MAVFRTKGPSSTRVPKRGNGNRRDTMKIKTYRLPTSDGNSVNSSVSLASTQTSRSINSSSVVQNRTETASFEVVESQSSTSHAPVIRNWATKYDTEDMYNYDSNEDIESSRGSERVKRREENVDQKSMDTPNLAAVIPKGKEASTWTRSVAELITTDQPSKAQIKRFQADFHEKKTSTFACNSDFGGRKGECKRELQNTLDDDDDESSAEWFLNTFHQSDSINVNKMQDRTLKMIGRRSLSTSISFENDELSSKTGEIVEAKKYVDQEAMTAELAPLALELDSLTSKEMEEEVVFYNDAKSNTVKFLTATLPQKEETPPSTTAHEGANFLDVADAITSLCLTPRAQQQLLEEERKKVSARLGGSVTPSLSSSDDDYPNIELELRRNDDVDEIIIVDAVARALRRPKKKASPKKEPKNVSSDAMDVLMSLTVFECGKSVNDDLNITGLNNYHSSGVWLRKEETTPTELRAMDILANLNGNDKPRIFESEEVRDKSTLAILQGDGNQMGTVCEREAFDNNDQSSKGHVENYAARNFEFSKDQPKYAGIKCGNENPEKDSGSATKELSTSEKETPKPAIFKYTDEEQNKNKMDDSTASKNNEDTSSTTHNPFGDESEGIRTKPSDEFQQDGLTLEKLDLIAESDSFSIDKFCDNSFAEDDPIRVKPCVMMTKKSKRSTQKVDTFLPLGKEKSKSSFSDFSAMSSSSFGIVASLSSSDDCHIPTPPQLRKTVFSSHQNNRQNMESRSETFISPLDLQPVPDFVLPPLKVLPCAIHSEKPGVSAKTNAKKKKKKRKKKNRSKIQDDDSLSSSKTTTKEPSERFDFDFDHNNPGERGKSILFSHAAINKMVRNGKKTSTIAKKRLFRRQKSEDKNVQPGICSRAEDSIRMGRNLCSPHIASSSLTQQENRENHFPISSREPNVEERLPPPKGIMRVKHDGASKLPLATVRSVHWDEKQLANKVEKGVMVGVSSGRRKCRPIRVLEKHMLEITAVQNGYGSERVRLTGIKNSSQGYIC